MARQKAQFIPAPEDVEDVFEVMHHQPIEKTDAETKADLFAEALAEDPSAFITVHMESEGNSPEVFVNRYPADKYDLSQLQKILKDEEGGGDFRVRLYVKGRLRQNKLIQITKSKRAEKLPEQQLDGVAGILQAVMANQEKMQRQMFELVNNRQNSHQQEMDFLNKMVVYKQLFSNDSSPVNGLGQLRDTIGLLKDVGINVGGIAEEREPGFMDILDKATPLIAAAVTQKTKETEYKPNPAPRKPQMMQQMMIKAGIKQLLNAANKGADPAIYAEMLLDQLDENTVRSFITSEGAFAKLVSIDPRCGNFQPWFDDLAEHVKAQLGMESRFADQYGEENSLTENDEENTTDENGSVE